MACSVQITGIRAQPVPPPGQPVGYVVVSGTATGCDSHLVSGQIVDPATGAPAGGFMDVAVDNSGNWSTTVKVSTACGRNLTVSAWCMHTASCQGQATLPVDCCPSANVVLVLKDSNGNQVGAEAMTVGQVFHVAPGTYTVEVVQPISPPGLIFSWTIGIAVSPTGSPISPPITVSDGQIVGVVVSIQLTQSTCPIPGGYLTLVVEQSCPLLVGGLLNSGCAPSGVSLSVDVTGDATHIQAYQWTFGDGTPPQNGGADINHTYAQAGDYVVAVTSIPTAGSTCAARTATFAITVPQCTNPTTTTTTGTAGRDPGPFDLCCFLIYSWLGGFIFAMTAWKLGHSWFWVALVIAFGFLLVWIHKCCKRCLKVKHWYDYVIRPDRVLAGIFGCCAVIRWHILAHLILLAIVYPLIDGTADVPALMAAVCSRLPVLCNFLNVDVSSGSANAGAWNDYVEWIVAAGLAFWSALYAAMGCRAGQPSVYLPTSWPRCKCKKK